MSVRMRNYSSFCLVRTRVNRLALVFSRRSFRWTPAYSSFPPLPLNMTQRARVCHQTDAGKSENCHLMPADVSLNGNP